MQFYVFWVSPLLCLSFLPVFLRYLLFVIQRHKPVESLVATAIGLVVAGVPVAMSQGALFDQFPRQNGGGSSDADFFPFFCSLSMATSATLLFGMASQALMDWGQDGLSSREANQRKQGQDGK